MGDRSPARRCSASKLWRTRWNDQHSSGSESVHGGFTDRLLRYSERVSSVSGPGDHTEAYAQSQDSGGECEYDYRTSRYDVYAEADTCSG